MAVFPDRIVLKNSADSEAEIIAAIETGGDDEITQGELVIGLVDGGTKFYTKDANGNIVSLGGAGTGPQYIDDLLDVDTSTNLPAVDQALVWDGVNWMPGEGGSGTNPGPTPPADPNTGDLWFDTDNNLLFVWSGAEWISIEGGGGGGTGGLVFWGGGDFTTGVSDGEPADGGVFTV